jgi:hypothetical protein
MRFKDLRVNQYYLFEKSIGVIELQMIGKIIYKNNTFINIKPTVFITGYGDVDDIREFNELALDTLYNKIYEIEYQGTNRKDYPEWLI